MFGYLWIIYPGSYDWQKVAAAFPILIFLIYCNVSHKESLKDIGFVVSNWRYPVKINLIFIVITVPLLSFVWSFFFPFNKDIHNGSFSLGRMFFVYPFGALCQQYLFFGFFFRRYREFFAEKKVWAIFFTALTFSAVHFPNPSLLLLTFIAGLVWGKIYSVQPNLYPNAVSHALLGVFALFILGVYGEVGPMANPWQWSKSQDISGVIASVNSIIPKRDEGRVIKTGKQVDEVIIRGYIESAANIKEACLVFNGFNYPLDNSFVSGNNLNFIKRISITNLIPRDYKLAIRVFMKEKYVNDYYYSPGKEVFIKKLPEIYFNNQLPISELLQRVKVRRTDRKKYVISNTNTDLIETEYKFDSIELDRVFNLNNPEYFKDSLEFLRNMDKGYEVFIIIKDNDINNSLATTFRSDFFKKFLFPLGQCKSEEGETFILYFYQHEKT